MNARDSTPSLSVSKKTMRFTESIIRGMTRHCIRHNAINLSQGTPGFDPPESVKQAAIDAIQNGCNQYSVI